MQTSENPFEKAESLSFKLMEMDDLVWKRLRIIAGWSSLPNEKTAANSQAKYYAALRLELSRMGIKVQDLSPRTFQIIAGEGYYSLLKFLDEWISEK